MRSPFTNNLLMKRVLIAFLLLLGIGVWWAFSLLKSPTLTVMEFRGGEPQSSSRHRRLEMIAKKEFTYRERGNLPILDETPKFSPRNLSGDETGLYCHGMGNYRALAKLSLVNSEEAQAVLLDRMNDLSLRWETRLLYAVVLANQGNENAQIFIIDQYNIVSNDRVPDVMQAMYWVWRMPWLDELEEGENIFPSMSWAESTMLAALADKSPCTVDTPIDGEYFVRDLAIHFGNFHIILTDQKCKMAVPVLCSFLMDSMSLAPADELFADGYQHEAQKILRTLAEWDDPAVEPAMLEVVRRVVNDDLTIDVDFQDAMHWLVSRKNNEVIGLVLDDLYLDSVFSALEETRHEPYLIAIREKLAELGDGDLKDDALARQMSARENAIAILKHIEESGSSSESEPDNLPKE